MGPRVQHPHSLQQLQLLSGHPKSSLKTNGKEVELSSSLAVGGDLARARRRTERAGTRPGDARRGRGWGGWGAGSRVGCWPPPVWPLQCPELRMPCGFQAVPQTPAEAAGPGESARPLPAALILASGCVAASLQPLLPSHGLSSRLVSLRGTLVAGLGARLGSPG